MKFYFPLHLDGGNRGCEAIAKGTAILLNVPKENLIGLCTDVELDKRLGTSDYVTLVEVPQMTKSKLLLRKAHRLWAFRHVKHIQYVYKQRYERGKPVTKLEVIGDTTIHGTKVHFKPDPEIFEDTVFVTDTLIQRLRELAFLTRGVKIIVRDERNVDDEGKIYEKVFHYEGGIISFVEYINKGKTPLHEKPMYFYAEREDANVEIAMQYTDGYAENIFTFANNINTIEGGTHLVGFKTALTKVLNDYARKYNLLKDSDKNLMGDDVREGLSAIISVKLTNPEFEGQTKTKLGNSEIRGLVENIVKDLCEELFSNNKLEQLHSDYKRVYDCSKNLTQKTVEIAQNTIKGVYEAKQKINRSLVQRVLYSSMLINGQRVRIYHKDFLENPAVLTELFEK